MSDAGGGPPEQGPLRRSVDVVFPAPIDDVAADATTRRDSLAQRLAAVGDGKLRFQRAMDFRFRAAVLLLTSTIPVEAVLHSEAFASIPAAAGLVFLFLGLLTRSRVRSIQDEIVDIRNERDLLELAGDVREQRAMKLLQVGQVALTRYYEQTLQQGAQIFYFGFVAIVLGLAVIGATIWLIQGDNLGDGLSPKIVVAALGAISGILANYVAVMYLRMFSDTMSSVGKFHGRLVERDRLGLGNVLAAKIDTRSVREQTLREMAISLANGHATVAEAEAILAAEVPDAV